MIKDKKIILGFLLVMSMFLAIVGVGYASDPVVCNPRFVLDYTLPQVTSGTPYSIVVPVLPRAGCGVPILTSPQGVTNFGLPSGLSLTGTNTPVTTSNGVFVTGPSISGITTQTGVFTISFTATDPDYNHQTSGTLTLNVLPSGVATTTAPITCAEEVIADQYNVQYTVCDRQYLKTARNAPYIRLQSLIAPPASNDNRWYVGLSGVDSNGQRVSVSPSGYLRNGDYMYLDNSVVGSTTRIRFTINELGQQGGIPYLRITPVLIDGNGNVISTPPASGSTTPPPPSGAASAPTNPASGTSSPPPPTTSTVRKSVKLNINAPPAVCIPGGPIGGTIAPEPQALRALGQGGTLQPTISINGQSPNSLVNRFKLPQGSQITLSVSSSASTGFPHRLPIRIYLTKKPTPSEPASVSCPTCWNSVPGTYGEGIGYTQSGCQLVRTSQNLPNGNYSVYVIVGNRGSPSLSSSQEVFFEIGATDVTAPVTPPGPSAPSPPSGCPTTPLTGLSATLQPNNKVTLSWPVVPNAQYDVRLDDGGAHGRDGTITDSRFTNCDPHYYCKNGINPSASPSQQGVSVSENRVILRDVPVVPSTSYTFWIGSRLTTGACPSSQIETFFVPAITLGVGIECPLCASTIAFDYNTPVKSYTLCQGQSSIGGVSSSNLPPTELDFGSGARLVVGANADVQSTDGSTTQRVALRLFTPPTDAQNIYAAGTTFNYNDAQVRVVSIDNIGTSNCQRRKVVLEITRPVGQAQPPVSPPSAGPATPPTPAEPTAPPVINNVFLNIGEFNPNQNSNPSSLPVIGSYLYITIRGNNFGNARTSDRELQELLGGDPSNIRTRFIGNEPCQWDSFSWNNNEIKIRIYPYHTSLLSSGTYTLFLRVKTERGLSNILPVVITLPVPPAEIRDSLSCKSRLTYLVPGRYRLCAGTLVGTATINPTELVFTDTTALKVSTGPAGTSGISVNTQFEGSGLIGSQGFRVRGAASTIVGTQGGAPETIEAPSCSRQSVVLNIEAPHPLLKIQNSATTATVTRGQPFNIEVNGATPNNPSPILLTITYQNGIDIVPGFNGVQLVDPVSWQVISTDSNGRRIFTFDRDRPVPPATIGNSITANWPTGNFQAWVTVAGKQSNTISFTVN